MTVATKATSRGGSADGGGHRGGAPDPEDGDDAGHDAADGKGGGDDRVGRHAQHAGHGEVIGSGAQGNAQHGPPQEQGQQRQRDDAGDDGEDIAPGHAGAGDHHAGLEDLRQGHRAGARGDDQQGAVLQQGADREGGDQHGGQGFFPHRAEGHQLGEQAGQHGSHHRQDGNHQPGQWR